MSTGDLTFYWMGSRNFLIRGERGTTPIFDLLADRLILQDSIAVVVHYGHDIPPEVWERLAFYEANLSSLPGSEA